MATNINNKLVCNEPHANLDSYYGPYDSVDAAFNALADTTVNGVNYTKKYIGLTVGVWNSAKTEITEYWFKGGTAKANLVVKTDGSGGGLPSGIKIVTFDKNGGSGVQNSILTDTTSQVVLPECTFTKTGETFNCWTYNGTQKNPGQTITVGSTTVVQAQWSSSPTPKPSHVITWTAGTGINKIAGTANGVAISSGESVEEGSTIALTATPNSGYNFSQWSGLPSGTSTTSNPVSFAMGTSNISVTAIGKAVAQKYTITVVANPSDGGTVKGDGQYDSGATATLDAEPNSGYRFVSWSDENTDNPRRITVTKDATYTAIFELIPTFTVSFGKGTGVSDIKGVKGDGSDVENGKQYDEGTEIKLTATLEDGYDYVVWEPNNIGTVTPDTLTLVFTLTDNVEFKATGQKSDDAKFYYYGCSANESDAPQLKCFTTPVDLRKSKESEVNIDRNTNNYLYVVMNDNGVTPHCIPNGGEPLVINKITECGDDELIRYLIQNQWITDDGKTGDALSEYGDSIYLLIDRDNKISKRQSITISVK